MIMIVRDKRHSDRDTLTFDFQAPDAQKKAKPGAKEGSNLSHHGLWAVFRLTFDFSYDSFKEISYKESVVI